MEKRNNFLVELNLFSWILLKKVAFKTWLNLNYLNFSCSLNFWTLNKDLNMQYPVQIKKCPKCLKSYYLIFNVMWTKFHFSYSLARSEFAAVNETQYKIKVRLVHWRYASVKSLSTFFFWLQWKFFLFGDSSNYIVHLI